MLNQTNAELRPLGRTFAPRRTPTRRRHTCTDTQPPHFTPRDTQRTTANSTCTRGQAACRPATTSAAQPDLSLPRPHYSASLHLLAATNPPLLPHPHLHLRHATTCSLRPRAHCVPTRMCPSNRCCCPRPCFPRRSRRGGPRSKQRPDGVGLQPRQQPLLYQPGAPVVPDLRGSLRDADCGSEAPPYRVEPAQGRGVVATVRVLDS